MGTLSFSVTQILHQASANGICGYTDRRRSVSGSAKPASAGYKTLDFWLVRAGGLGLCSRGFNRQVQDVNKAPSISSIAKQIKHLPRRGTEIGCHF